MDIDSMDIEKTITIILITIEIIMGLLINSIIMDIKIIIKTISLISQEATISENII
jgi:hypothetical protein